MSQIRECFISRYNNGVIVEADYSQLEVIYLAHVTKDKQLIEDIMSGKDLHRESAAELFDIPLSLVTDGQRKAAKAFRFMLQYGSGAPHMSEQTGHPLEVAQRFIKQYYDRYPRVKQWQDQNIDYCIKHKAPIAEHTPQGNQVEMATIIGETGRRYSFTTQDSPDWMQDRGKYTSFSPTKIKNYPVQGGATGDIVPLMLGVCYRWLLDSGLVSGVKLIATIHDSIVLDVHPEYIDETIKGIKPLLESAPLEYYRTFGIKFDMPLKVDVKMGPSWGDLSKVDYDKYTHIE